jgi:hypothetical protein
MFFKRFMNLYYGLNVAIILSYSYVRETFPKDSVLFEASGGFNKVLFEMFSAYVSVDVGVHPTAHSGPAHSPHASLPSDFTVPFLYTEALVLSFRPSCSTVCYCVLSTKRVCLLTIYRYQVSLSGLGLRCFSLLSFSP